VREVRFEPLIRGPRSQAAVIAVVVVVADQLSKAWALDRLAGGAVNIVGKAVRFELTRNSGAAFGLLEGAGSWLALLAVVIVVVVFLSLHRDMGLSTVLAMGFVLGGAVGNLGDRLFRGDGLADGLVVDFIDIGPWPNFNIADSAIVVGIILILWESLNSPSQQTSPPS
jgi:signal peptidase II